MASLEWNNKSTEFVACFMELHKNVIKFDGIKSTTKQKTMFIIEPIII